MEEKMILTDVNNNEVECNIVARWAENNQNYIAYTTGSMTDGYEDLFIAKCLREGENIKIIEIESDEEWNSANEFLNKIMGVVK